MIKELWGERWVKCACLQASGTKEGIMMLWDSRLWRGEVLEIGSYILTCKFEAMLQDYKCHITGVYAPNCRFEREHVWEEIGAVRSLFEGPWAVCDDFNVTRFPPEKIARGEHQQ